MISKQILSEIIRCRHKPEKCSSHNVSWNNRSELGMYVHGNNFTIAGQEWVDKFIRLENLFNKVSGIEGTTSGGRLFTVKWYDNKFHTQIFEKDGVYEPYLKLEDVITGNILSIINRHELEFFWKKLYVKTERKLIKVTGSQNNDKFVAMISINNSYCNATLNFKSNSNALRVVVDIPNHIDHTQNHIWLYRHLLKPSNIEESIEYNIRENNFRCCGSRIYGNYKFCHFCGKDQKVKNFIIDEVAGTELLTLLT